MGNVAQINCTGGRGAHRGGGSQRPSETLKELLVQNYGTVAADFNQLAPEQKKAFLGLFPGMTEEEFGLGAARIEMELTMIDDESDAEQILQSLNDMLNQVA